MTYKNPMKQLIILSLILLIASVSGCYYDSEEHLYPKLSTPCDDTVVTFSGTVTSIMQPCLSCHSNANALNEGGAIKLQNYADVIKMVTNGKLMGSITHANGFIPMPNGGGKLVDCEINQLQKWIDNGTPNN